MRVSCRGEGNRVGSGWIVGIVYMGLLRCGGRCRRGRQRGSGRLSDRNGGNVMGERWRRMWVG